MEPTTRNPLMRSLIHTLIIASLCGAVYFHTFGMSFQFDDVEYVKDNPVIRDPRFIAEPSRLKDFGLFETHRQFMLRYVTYLTFAMNYSLGGLHVAGYHVFNFAIHVVNCLVVYWLIIIVFRAPALRGSALGNSAGAIALLSALLFAAHPIQTEAVTYISQRFASLMATFYLLCMALYLNFRTSERRNLPLYALSLLLAVAAMKTKENAFTLPFVLLLAEALLLDGPWKRKSLYLLPMFMTIPIIPIGVIDFRKPLVEAIIGGMKTQELISNSDYFLTQLRVIPTYVRLLLLPVNQNLDYDYPVYDSLFHPSVFPSALLLAAILGAGAYLLHRARGGDGSYRLMAFGIFMFFIALSVESSIFSLEDVIFEHRVYLPSVGAFLAVVSAAMMVLRPDRNGNIKMVRAGAVSIGVLVILAFSALTFSRNNVWRDEAAMWEDVTSKSPRKARGHLTLAIAYRTNAMYEKSIAHSKRALELKPRYPEAYINLAIIHSILREQDQALHNALMAVRQAPMLAKAHSTLGSVYMGMGEREKARKELQLTIELNPFDDNARMLLNFFGTGGASGNPRQ